MIQLLLALLVVPAVIGQKCQDGKDTMPCEVGEVCPINNQICITDTPDGIFVCCPKDAVITTTTARPITPATADCKDLPNPKTKVSDCPHVAYLCSDPVYKEVMEVQCPKTCGFCGTTNPSTGSCQDLPNQQTGTSDCPNLKYLCNDGTYRQLMKEQCPKTCGYC